MGINDDDRRWIEALDPDTLTGFDRGRLRALATYADGEDRDRVEELLTGRCTHGDDDRSDHPYYRGLMRGRRYRRSRYPIQKEN